MKRWGNRILVLVLFAALVVMLLKFQGILLRKEHATVAVPAGVPVGASDRTAVVERRVLPDVQVYPGFVEAVEPADIAARVMATIVTLDGEEGDRVAAGQALVTLDDRDARARVSQAEAALEAGRAQALQARLAFERAARLLEAEALTPEDWEAARAARDAAQAQELRAAKALEEAQAALSWCTLTAPFAGRVLARHADPGFLATPGRPILSLYREDALRLEVAVPEERAAGIAAGDELEIELDGLVARRARVARVLPSADPSTGTVLLYLVPASLEGLRPGLLGRLRLVVGRREALVLPAEAIERIGQIERVQRVTGGTLVPTTVRTGKVHDGVVEILSGLDEGEEVRLP